MVPESKKKSQWRTQVKKNGYIFGDFFFENFMSFLPPCFHFLELYDDVTRFSTKMLLILDNCLAQRRIQAGSSRDTTGLHHLLCCVPGSAFANDACNH